MTDRLRGQCVEASGDRPPHGVRATPSGPARNLDAAIRARRRLPWRPAGLDAGGSTDAWIVSTVARTAARRPPRNDKGPPRVAARRAR